MVTKYGMDDDLGQLVYVDDNDYSAYKPFSEKTAELIDTKVKKLVSDAYIKAIKLIKTNKKLMESMAELLLEREYISRDEFELMMKDPKKIKEKVKEIRKKK